MSDPTPKHDGKLDKEGETEVEISGTIVRIEDLYHCIILYPSQALSLLAWLRQEEATLTSLAKEQQSVSS